MIGGRQDTNDDEEEKEREGWEIKNSGEKEEAKAPGVDDRERRREGGRERATRRRALCLDEYRYTCEKKQ